MRESEDEYLISSCEMKSDMHGTLSPLADISRSDSKDRLALVMESPVLRESLHFMLANALAECTIDSYASLGDVPLDRTGLILLCQSSISEGLVVMRERIEAVRTKFPSVALVVMSHDDDIDLANVVLRCGAKGYLMPTLGTSAFVAAIRLAMTGGIYVPTSLIERWTAGQAPAGDDTASRVEPLSSRSSPAVSAFTMRELDVIERLQSGQPNKLIAYELNMSESTVKVHMRNIMRKVGATNRTQVAFYVRGIKTPAPPNPFASTVAHKLSTSSAGRVTPLSVINTVEVNRARLDSRAEVTLAPRV